MHNDEICPYTNPHDLLSTYLRLGNYNQAIKDLDKAIELNPILSSAYYGMGNAYGRLGDDLKKTNDWKIAARLGDTEAQNSLREQGINR